MSKKLKNEKKICLKRELKKRKFVLKRIEGKKSCIKEKGRRESIRKSKNIKEEKNVQNEKVWCLRFELCKLKKMKRNGFDSNPY